ncbi:MAG: mobile mystery protein A [Bacilli bacterium]|nr:mobile mystery protein A [Bacilli bacterium]
MKNIIKKLQLDQLDKKIKSFDSLSKSMPGDNGWVYALRSALGMSLSQLGKRLDMTAQSVKELENREKEQTASLRSLAEVARALDLQFVYGFAFKKNDNLKKMVSRKAYALAQEIVLRTDRTMRLENQGISKIRFKNAVKEKAAKIIEEMPRHLWD